MLSYKYTARDPKTGEKTKAFVQADNIQNAAKLIRAQGLSPIDIVVQDDSSTGLLKFVNRVRTKDRILFTRQLATLINAGLPLIQSLRSVMSQTTSKPLKVICGRVISDIEEGSTLSAAVGRFPNVFNEIFISLVAAGEVSGTLDKSLERVADQQEKDADIISKVRGAMIYPAVVLGVMLLVMGFMITTVLPQVGLLYDGINGAQLPFVTVMLLAVSDFVIKFWWLLLILVLAGVVLGSRWIQTLGGRRVLDKAKMRLWPFGPLFMKMYMARFARTGATLVASGVPLLQIMEITARSVNNVHIADSLKRASQQVKGGKALSDSLSNDPNFLELVPNMIRIGEQSGSLEAMLDKVASYYEKEVDNQIKTISTIIEPVMMIVLGIVAMIIVAAVLLPIYSLANKGFGS